MADISKLKERILRDAREAAENLLNETRNEAGRLLEAARAQAEADEAQIMKEAASDAIELEKRMLSAARLEARKSKLKMKQNAIDDVFQKALEMLKALPDGEYFGILSKMTLTGIKTGNEELIMSPGDYKRMPADFADKLDAKTGGHIRILEGNAGMGPGFILRDGEVEINGTFDTIFKMRRESIETDVYGTLFRDKGE